MRAMLLRASLHPCPPGPGWGSQAPVRPHFSRRSAGVMGPEAGDLMQLLLESLLLVAPLCRPAAPVLIVAGAFCRCWGASSPASLTSHQPPCKPEVYVGDTSNWCLVSELGGKAHLEPSAKPAGLAFCRWGWGQPSSGGLWKAGGWA